MKKPKHWKRCPGLAYASAGFLNRAPRPRKKPIRDAPDAERVPGSVADADKRQG